MTDRDHFAAAALTGLIARAGKIPFDGVADCYEWADAMLRERERTNHDAAPAARAPEPEPEAARRRPAGGTGESQEPVVWAVMLADNHRIWGVYALEEEANAINDVVAGGHGVAPLYLQPQPTLTDAEREAVEWFSNFARPQNGPVIGRHAAALRGLLERTGGANG
jgi:hypothetical protein